MVRSNLVRRRWTWFFTNFFVYLLHKQVVLWRHPSPGDDGHKNIVLRKLQQDSKVITYERARFQRKGHFRYDHIVLYSQPWNELIVSYKKEVLELHES